LGDMTYFVFLFTAKFLNCTISMHMTF